jgi:hypothetical protein
VCVCKEGKGRREEEAHRRREMKTRVTTGNLNRVDPDAPGIYGLLARPVWRVQKVISITSEQQVSLLCSYVPFFIIPLCIGVDMAFRPHKLAYAGIRALKSSKE